MRAKARRGWRAMPERRNRNFRRFPDHLGVLPLNSLARIDVGGRRLWEDYLVNCWTWRLPVVWLKHTPSILLPYGFDCLKPSLLRRLYLVL